MDTSEDQPRIGIQRLDSGSQLENVIRQARNRQVVPAGDPSIYIDESGRKLSTKERIVTEVEPPIRTRPPDSSVFLANGLPDYRFLRQHFRREGRLHDHQVVRILRMASEAFSIEPNLLRVGAPVTVCGDIHGQFYDLCKLFEICQDPDQTAYLFLGDYVDRGSYSLECLLLLYAMKLNHRTTFYMIRGNHESERMTEYFTFKEECLQKHGAKVYQEALESFKTLPLAAIMNGQFFCVHGGISKHLRKVQDLESINRFVVDFPSSGLFCDLMWADPSNDYDEVLNEPDFVENYERGCSYMFSYNAVNRFLQDNGLLCLIRAHQAQDSGYRMYRKTKSQQFPSMMTLFSAPNYCGTYGNKAAVLRYDTKLMNIRQFGSQLEPYRLPNGLGAFTWSIPFVAERTADILLHLLNICSEEELSSEEPQAAEEQESSPVDYAALRKKILAIGRVSRMFNMLREEAQKVEQLRTLSGGAALPKGVLLNGPEELDRTLTSFEHVRLADLHNEAMPPK
ncbi:hypothetical protein OGAPHI_006961 [Ogataea philodendri]|uniref:Serine/threonine-protein phosphatase n=1 Tax=Ogataea philodendri TaxID=1378263 RepID=A0A9P8NVB6_9ASCO|nr:uncharacterized protein OGAPHI_006961 [Ogataea philodendri]KAH3660375.1 hypothetical protein OGAPHI_006961 [Ogataea philodendri]